MVAPRPRPLPVASDHSYRRPAVEAETHEVASRLLQRSFESVEGKTDEKIDLVVVSQEEGLAWADAEPALDFLSRRGLLEVRVDTGYLTDRGVEVVIAATPVVDVPEEGGLDENASAEFAMVDPHALKDEDEIRKPQLRYPGPDGELLVQEVGWSIVVGRSDEADIIIDDRRASKRHFEVRYEAERYVIEDLDSSNGTMLNGRYIAFETLNHGDSILVGHTEVIFECPDEIPVPEGEPIDDDAIADTLAPPSKVGEEEPEPVPVVEDAEAAEEVEEPPAPEPRKPSVPPFARPSHPILGSSEPAPAPARARPMRRRPPSHPKPVAAPQKSASATPVPPMRASVAPQESSAESEPVENTGFPEQTEPQPSEEPTFSGIDRELERMVHTGQLRSDTVRSVPPEPSVSEPEAEAEAEAPTEAFDISGEQPVVASQPPGEVTEEAQADEPRKDSSEALTDPPPAIASALRAWEDEAAPSVSDAEAGDFLQDTPLAPSLGPPDPADSPRESLDSPGALADMAADISEEPVIPQDFGDEEEEDFEATRISPAPVGFWAHLAHLKVQAESAEIPERAEIVAAIELLESHPFVRDNLPEE